MAMRQAGGLLSWLPPRSRVRWTCVKCRTGQQSAQSLPRPAQWTRPYGARSGDGSGFAGARGNYAPPPRRRRGLMLAATTGSAAAVGALAFTDDIKYGYEAAERAGRVAAALAICVNE